MGLISGGSILGPPRKKDGSEGEIAGGDGECTGSAGDRRVADCQIDEGLPRCLVPRRVDCWINDQQGSRDRKQLVEALEHRGGAGRASRKMALEDGQ